MKRVFFFSLSVLLLSGCSRDQTDISAAYERQEQINIAVTEEAETTETAAETTEASEPAAEVQTASFDSSGMPPRVVTIESQIMNPEDTISYLGIELSVDKSKEAKSLDELKDFMDSEKAEQFKEQILNGENVTGIDNEGNIQFPESESFIFIDCKFVNTKEEEVRINMQIPLYCAAVDLKSMGSSKSVNMTDFIMTANALDFYGQHDKYIDPKVGKETSSSSQYHVLSPKETFETVLVVKLRTDNVADPTYYICSAILSDSIGTYNFPAGTYLIPLEME